MFCRNCGAEIPEGGGFCGSCGTPVKEEPVAVRDPEGSRPVMEGREREILLIYLPRPGRNIFAGIITLIFQIRIRDCRTDRIRVGVHALR